MSEDRPKHIDFEIRQQQKARSRQNDEERLARGEVSASELQRENMPFRKLRFDRVSFLTGKRAQKGVYLYRANKGEGGDTDDK